MISCHSINGTQQNTTFSDNNWCTAIVATCLNYILEFVYAQNKFRAKLDADNEVPPVDSKAEGVATFKIKDDAIKSTVNVTGIADVSGAQIFMGKIGQNGDPIVDLLKTGEKTERSDGVAIKGNFTASDFEGSMQGKDLSCSSIRNGRESDIC